MKMKQEDKVWWERARAKGRLSFVLREGVRVGTWVALIATVSAISGGLKLNLIWIIAAWLGATAFFGSLIGVVLWNQHEKNLGKV